MSQMVRVYIGKAAENKWVALRSQSQYLGPPIPVKILYALLKWNHWAWYYPPASFICVVLCDLWQCEHQQLSGINKTDTVVSALIHMKRSDGRRHWQLEGVSIRVFSFIKPSFFNNNHETKSQDRFALNVPFNNSELGEIDFLDLLIIFLIDWLIVWSIKDLKTWWKTSKSPKSCQ